METQITSVQPSPSAAEPEAASLQASTAASLQSEPIHPSHQQAGRGMAQAKSNLSSQNALRSPQGKAITETASQSESALQLSQHERKAETPPADPSNEDLHSSTPDRVSRVMGSPSSSTAASPGELFGSAQETTNHKAAHASNGSESSRQNRTGIVQDGSCSQVKPMSAASVSSAREEETGQSAKQALERFKQYKQTQQALEPHAKSGYRSSALQSSRVRSLSFERAGSTRL